MSSVDQSTVTSRLKAKDAEPFNPEESSRFRGKKRTAEESVEYQAYSNPKTSDEVPVRPRKPRKPLSSSRGLKHKSPCQRMTKSGPVDSPSNPFAPGQVPEKVGESSSSKYTLKPARFTPKPKLPVPEVETKEMSSESKRGMPNRRDNKAPSYDRSRPEELLRYIEDVEKEMDRVGVESDLARKDWLRYYADQRTADEWTVLETYGPGGGSYDDFKEELISHYPEATDSLEGSIARLDRLCSKATPLTHENLSVALEFIRGFKFEGRKLLDGGCISNREIVAKFLNCLDPEFRKTVSWQMTQESLKEISFGKEKARHHMDPIEFEALVKVSEKLVRSYDSYTAIASKGPSLDKTIKPTDRTQHTILQRPTDSPMSASSSDRMVQLLEDLNESMAKNTDVLVNMSKENGQRHGETAKSIETVQSMLTTWNKGERDRPCNPSYPISSNQTPMRRDGCYYCWIVGHFIADCQLLAADVAEGKLIAQDNGSGVDSRQFPKEPRNLSPRDRVDLAWKNRKQFVMDDFLEDSIVNLTPTQSSIVTLQSNWKGRDKKDELISELMEKARRAAEERDMWKAVTATRQAGMSAPPMSQAPQVIPQPVSQSSVDPKSTEFMTMLAKMMSLTTTNSEDTEKGFIGAQ